jgi:hypothetical protein
MKEKTRYIAIAAAVLLALILFSGITVCAGSKDTDEGYKDGYGAGWTDGMEAAWEDLDEDRRKNYSKAIPSNSEIKEYYELDEESNDYEDGFLDGYRDGFREGYNFGYENPESGAASQVNYDRELGYSMGEIRGRLDYWEGLENSWNHHVPKTIEIIQLFGLKMESEAYKNDFITEFRVNYKKGYEYGYRMAKFEPMMTAMEQGAKDGELFGGIMGAGRGRLDYYSGSVSQWDRKLPSDSSIKALFLLPKDSEGYGNAFLAAFKSAYRTKYEEAYRKANIEKNLLLFERGYEQGREIGVIRGASLARIDRTMNLTNYDTRKNYIDQDIIKEYMLFNEDEKYREGFISGFREGLKEGYITEYRDSNYEYGKSKVVTETIPISGAEIFSGDSLMKLSIEKGTFYNIAAVSIDKTVTSNANIKLPSKEGMIKASEFYTISVANSSSSVNPDKSAEFSFEYYGPANGGIYKYSNGSWIYLPSRINGNSISTKLSPRSINNRTCTYGVFIDENARDPYDLRGNWAKDEIAAYLRRGIAEAYPDGSFRPDSPLTRGQAAAWINNVYDTKLAAPEFPNNTVTYTEIEKLMKQATGDESFKWSYIAAKMALNKDKRSGSFSSMSGTVTRAEAIYMLYYLNE